MTIKDLTTIKIKEIKRDTIIHYPEIKDLCSRPYPNHPNGCPNREKCQMLNIPSFEVIDSFGKYTNYYLVYVIFNRKAYRESKEERDNLRWWQGSLKKLLKEKLIEIIKNNPKISYYIYGCGSGFKLGVEIGSMEHCHINVFSTMKLNGIKLDLNPKNKVILVCLISSTKPLLLNNNQNTLSGWL